MVYRKEAFNPVEYQALLEEFNQETARDPRVRNIQNRYPTSQRERDRQNREVLKQRLVKMQNEKWY